jgi:outer membrane protein assembly factor BamB
MGRLLRIWRSWSPRRRYAVVGGFVVLVVGVAIAGYVVLKRPGDVSNPNAAFVPEKAPVKKKPKAKDPTIDWPTYGFNDARTRYLAAPKVEPPFASSSWSFQAGKLLEFSPIIVGDRLYFMDIDANFYAMDANSGKVIWKHRIGTLNASAPTFERGNLYAVNLEPGHAVSLRAKDGKERWVTPLPGRSESSPLVYHDRVIFGCECGKVFALDAKTGKIRWTVDVAGAVKGALAEDNGTVFGGSYGGDVFAIDASSGKVKWTSNTVGGSFLRGGGVYSTPTVAYGRVYLGSIDSRVYSFEEKTGDLAWTHSTGAEVYTGPAVADTKHTDPTVYLGSADGNFYALDAKSGATVWQVPVGGQVTGAASVIGNVVYVSVIGKDVGTLGLKLTNGKKVYDNEIGEYNPAISDGRALYLTGYSELRKFLPKSLARKLKRKEFAKNGGRQVADKAKKKKAGGKSAKKKG